MASAGVISSPPPRTLAGMPTSRASGLPVSHSKWGHTLFSPVRVFLLVLGIVFATEFAIMLIFPNLPANLRTETLGAVVDSSILVTVLCPALWLLIVRPLRQLVAERGELLSRSLTIQERERSRIAGDLHDDVGQAQTAVLLGLSNIMQSPTLEQAVDRARSLHDVAAGAVDATRRLARGLSSSVLTDFGLAQATERLCEDVENASGMTITRQLELSSQRLSPAIEVALYRVLQEALTNAAKHSHAHTLKVTLRQEPKCVRLSIADNGQGIEDTDKQTTPLRSGLGIAGMRERITLLGGSFSIASIPGEGTTISAQVPVEVST